jgi:hypothetical protein
LHDPSHIKYKQLEKKAIFFCTEIAADENVSREAATECSPLLALSLSKGRKSWVASGKTVSSPGGAKEKEAARSAGLHNKQRIRKTERRKD